MFQLFTHGRSGELLLNGEWKNAKEIATFLNSTFNIQHSEFKTLNIYGCEFAKGEKGLKAVAYLEKALALKVNASTNITGKDGDWLLEVGDVNACEYNNYSYSLQTVSTSHKATACSNCTPTGWTNITGTAVAEGTVDVSSPTGWAGSTGSYAWQGTVSEPPVSGPNFISGFNKEMVETTVTGLTVGENYELRFAIAELRSTAGATGSTVDQNFDGTFRLRDGSDMTLADYPFSGGPSNDWSIKEYSFTATATTQIFRFGYAVGNGRNGNFWNLSVESGNFGLASNPCTDGATVGTATANDSDGDGINDVCDLDDDNDGVLDAVECSRDTFSTETSITTTGTTPATGNPQTLSAVGGTDLEVTLSSPNNAYVNRTTHDGVAGYWIGRNNPNEEITFSFDSPVTEIKIVASAHSYKPDHKEEMRLEVNGNTYTFIPGYFTSGAGNPFIAPDGLSIQGGLNGNGVGKFVYTISLPTGISSVRLHHIVLSGSPLSGTIYDVRVTGDIMEPCDTDNDGIPNYLDLDSDGDGCPDALEAGVSASNLQAGSVTNGNGTDDTANTTTTVANAQLDPAGADSNKDGLNDSVDNAPQDGTPDYTSTYDVNALDANEQSASCSDPCLVTGVVGGTTDIDDFDGDGVNNGCDIDDDNDGIIDLVECEQAEEAIAQSAYFDFTLSNSQVDVRYDASAGTEFTGVGPHNYEVGDYVVYKDIGVYQSVAVSLKVSVLANQNPDNTIHLGHQFNSAIHFPVFLDGTINGVENGTKTSDGAVKVKLEFIRTDTQVAYDVPLKLTFKDIDNDTANNSLENVQIKTDDLVSYLLSNDPATEIVATETTTNLFGEAGAFHSFTSTAKYDDLISEQIWVTSFHNLINELELVVKKRFGGTGYSISPVEFTEIPQTIHVNAGCSDLDGDNLLNNVDLDSDNDGITDNVEAQSTANYTAPSGPDTDGDGLLDIYEGTGDKGIDVVNTDGQDLPDYLDEDSDNEGANDTLEAGYTETTSLVDTDGDGILDHFDITPTTWGAVNNGLTTGANDLPDTDGDAATQDVDFRDDNTPILTIGSPNVIEGNNAEVIVSIDVPSSETTTVVITTNTGTADSGDYTATSVTVSIAPGETSVTVNIPTSPDTTDEPNETFTVGGEVTSGNTINTEATGTVTIIDNDTTPTLTIGSPNVTEGENAVVVISIDPPSNETTTVELITSTGSADTGDYTEIIVIITIPEGATTSVTNIPTTTDGIDEPNETFTVYGTVTSGNTTNTTTSGTVTIIDNNTTPIVIAVNDTATVNQGSSVLITILENDKNVPNEGTLAITTNPSNGTVLITSPENTPNDPSDDVVTYTPNENFTGVDTFEYTICNDEEPKDCSTAAVSVTVISATVTSDDNTDPCDAVNNPDWAFEDCDGDGAPNVEDISCADPCVGGNLTNVDLSDTTSDWYVADCDGDGVPNGMEVDPNRDGVTGPNNTSPTDPCDYNEEDVIAGTQGGDWTNADCDGDGVINGQEIIDETDPFDMCIFILENQTVAPSAAWTEEDCDGDGAPNVEGISYTDPCVGGNLTNVDLSDKTSDWYLADCDGDGVINGTEVDPDMDGVVGPNNTGPNDPCDYNITDVTLTPSDAWYALECEDVQIFNIISPNGDGINESLTIKNIEGIPNNTLTIFNRWGNTVYKVEGYGHNGNLFTGISTGRAVINKGKKLPVGTYYYAFTYKSIKTGKMKVLKGWVYIQL